MLILKGTLRRSRGFTLFDNGDIKAHSKEWVENVDIWQSTLYPYTSSLSTNIADTEIIFIQKGTASVRHDDQDEVEIVPAGSVIIMGQGERCHIEVHDPGREEIPDKDSIPNLTLTMITWPFSAK
ncbi:hypothetical protein C4566_03245 [Candidatus Parcubacteria bacterium]|nr:MAG: hypothetical protein C4566_03245 [Candidatus Parcubacteria bacterium]